MDTYLCPLCKNKFQVPGPGKYKCPSCEKEVEVKAPSFTQVPWDAETKGEWIGAFYNTIKTSLVDPISFFKAVARGQGFFRPWIYAIIISFMVFLVAAAYQAGFQVLELGSEMAVNIRKAVIPSLIISGPLAILLIGIMGLIAVPILTTIGLIIEAGIFHLGLLILGSAKREYTATFRTVCYCMGPNVFQIIPLIGGMISGIWSIVLCIIGIKVVHETSYGRSAIVVFLPLILCCGLILLFTITIAGGVFAAMITNP